jgi:phosphohistidine swiveling domain-containing protein
MGIQCLSPGFSEGKVVDISNIQPGSILAVTSLTPELVQYFSEISGIISMNGGMLSHLAIMAREAGIPVISGIPSPNLYLGKVIKMDANHGSIEVLS